MSLDKFYYVLTLAEERNRTRAAKKAFSSQLALTNYINKPESQLGIKLFRLALIEEMAPSPGS